MWQLYEGLHNTWGNLVSKRVAEAGEIIPVFREFFSKINSGTTAALTKDPERETL